MTGWALGKLHTTKRDIPEVILHWIFCKRRFKNSPNKKVTDSINRTVVREAITVQRDEDCCLTGCDTVTIGNIY
jgi:hypothetical protein